MGHPGRVLAPNTPVGARHARRSGLLPEPTELPEGTELVLAVVEDEGGAEERRALIAERVARARAGQGETLSLDDVERSIRDDLDL